MKKAISDLDLETADRIGLQAARDAVAEHVRAGRLVLPSQRKPTESLSSESNVVTNEVVLINLSIAGLAVMVLMAAVVISVGTRLLVEFDDAKWAPLLKSFWELSSFGMAIVSIVVVIVARSKLEIRITRTRETRDQ